MEKVLCGEEETFSRFHMLKIRPKNDEHLRSKKNGFIIKIADLSLLINYDC